jgi:hypothetical protein
MRIRNFSLLALALLLLGACGSGPEPGSANGALPEVEAGPPGSPGTSIAGLYEVTGTTTELESGDVREISGTLILAQKGDRYTSTFNLRTMFPTPSGSMPAEVIGMGEGEVDGGMLSGDAETQVVMSSVPGVDSAFAFMPRRVSDRILSSTLAEISPDGHLTIEIQSRAMPGGPNYSPTKTTLQGELVSKPGQVPPLR